MSLGPLPIPVPDVLAELWRLIEQVPAGCVTTFGNLAEALGERKRARWISFEFARAPEGVPIHRVVPSSFKPLPEFLPLLIREDVPIDTETGVISDEACCLNRFTSSAPLAELQEIQHDLADRVRLESLSEWPTVVGGVDVAYPTPTTAKAAYVEIDCASGEVIWSHTAEGPNTFPYISGYLSFREIPALWRLLDEVTRERSLPPVLLVDGSGIVHPRRAGLASHLGVLLDHPTLGVAKTLLVGDVDQTSMPLREARPIVEEGETIGAAVVGRKNSKPVFLSPGHRITVDEVTSLVDGLFHGHRLPEPTWHADRLSKG